MEYERKKDMSKRIYLSNYSKMTPDLIDTPIYNDKLMENVLVGIAQNIWVEMDRQGFSIRALAGIADVNYSQLTKIFNNRSHIGLKTMIRIAAALHMNPCELFPYDPNKRKTNGQRFEEITKGMDLTSINFLLEIVYNYRKEYNRLKRTR